jgi:hypothetical protein
MAKKIAGVKKRNPADGTIRNIRAANKRFAALEARIDELQRLFTQVTNWVKAQEAKQSSEVPE